MTAILNNSQLNIAAFREMTLEAIKYHNGKLEILDQLLLPFETKYIPIKDTEDGWKAIHDMQVQKWMEN